MSAIDLKRIAAYRQIHHINEPLAAAQEAVLRAADAMERHDPCGAQEALEHGKAVVARRIVASNPQASGSP